MEAWVWRYDENGDLRMRFAFFSHAARTASAIALVASVAACSTYRSSITELDDDEFADDDEEEFDEDLDDEFDDLDDDEFDDFEDDEEEEDEDFDDEDP